MLLIRHRVNTLEDLAAVSPDRGIELDLRSEGRELILHHDPFQPGLPFEELLRNYRHRFMIVNTKAEGLEQKALVLLDQYGIRDFFFLDLSFPALMALARRGEKRIAVRFSEHEPLESCLALGGLVEWVWVDCFTRCPLDRQSHGRLREHFRICLVSPELQKHPDERIAEFKQQLCGLELDAVCTKVPEKWI